MKLSHPCKETCSGWRHGWGAGFEEAHQEADAIMAAREAERLAAREFEDGYSDSSTPFAEQDRRRAAYYAARAKVDELEGKK